MNKSIQISRAESPARPAAQHYTATFRTGAAPVTIATMRLILNELAAEGVPDDAQLQLSWPNCYATWVRESAFIAKEARS